METRYVVVFAQNQGSGRAGGALEAESTLTRFGGRHSLRARLRFCPSGTARSGAWSVRTKDDLPFRGRVCMMVQNVGALARWLFRLACPAVL